MGFQDGIKSHQAQVIGKLLNHIGMNKAVEGFVNRSFGKAWIGLFYPGKYHFRRGMVLGFAQDLINNHSLMGEFQASGGDLIF